jgi:hypothetical protein
MIIFNNFVQFCDNEGGFCEERTITSSIFPILYVGNFLCSESKLKRQLEEKTYFEQIEHTRRIFDNGF